MACGRLSQLWTLAREEAFNGRLLSRLVAFVRIPFKYSIHHGPQEDVPWVSGQLVVEIGNLAGRMPNIYVLWLQPQRCGRAPDTPVVQ